MGLTTGFRNSAGKDIGSDLVEKSYLIDRYPELANTFRFAGLWLWGANSYGQLGDNTVGFVQSPIQTISGGTNWKLVAGGTYITTAIKTDGTLWLWGYNSYGQLGTGSGIVHRSSPVQTVSGGTNWKQVSAGGFTTGAIKTDGTLWTWGGGANGQLGNNTVSGRSSPGQTISAGTNWKQVSAGRDYTAAIKTDGTLWLWGKNSYGQLGRNDGTDRSSPIQTVSGGTNWKLVTSGYYHTAAIKTDGTLWIWGSNSVGELGTNNTTSRSSPVQTVSGGTNWKQVSLGNNWQHTAAIKTDGTLWTWGSNTNGGLGDNTTTPRSSPVQTVSGGTNWRQVSAGGFTTGAIKTDGTLWTWGSSAGLGDDNLFGGSVSSPIQTVSAGTNWKSVYCTNNGTVAIRDNSSDLFGESV